MNIKQMCLGEYQTNTYILSDPISGKCVIIDPADSGEKIAGYILENAFTPYAILLTHGHYDHILAIPVLQKQWPELAIYCHKADCPNETVEYDMGKAFPTVSAFSPLINYNSGAAISVGNINVHILHTPGHTKGSVVLRTEGALFTGDTVFAGSVGRTDLPGGDSTELMNSLRIIAGLDENLIIYPGHGPCSTVKHELSHNIYMRHALRSI